jgi:hypothetical protein
MRNVKPLLALLLTVILPVTALAAGQAQGQKPSSSAITVGDFAVMLAATVGKGKALEPKSATDALVKAGVPLGNPKAPLSEEKLTEILGFYGVRLSSSSPQQDVSRAKAQSALTLVSGALSSGLSSSAGTTPTPATLDDCLNEVNHGQCEGCCKTLGGTASTCAKFCQQIKTSQGEPQP